MATTAEPLVPPGARPTGRIADDRGTGVGTPTGPNQPVNPWKRLAQNEKVATVVAFLDRVLPMTADEAAELDERGRRAAAVLAGVRPLSDEAWALLVDALRKREGR